MASREQLSLVKGTTAQINAGTPALGEIWVNTDNHTLVVGDGSTAGGWPVGGGGSGGPLAFRASGVDLNAAGDTAVTIVLPSGFSRYQIKQILLGNASASLATAHAGVFTGAGATGVTIVAAQALSTITTNANNTSGNGMDMTLALPCATWFNAGTLYFNVNVTQSATVDVAIEVLALS